MNYTPVLDMRTKQWMVGVTEDFKARPLSSDEVESVCAKLNAREEELNREARDG
ncbi:MAG: hypothetical protein IMZ71_03740 [Chloroflexi bacterium]|nr:hypothetical protein [Chloroflexota bacterium]